MRGTRFQFIPMALACAGMAVAPAPRASSGDVIPSAATVPVQFLVPTSQLDEVALTIVDDKLAMSLAVEAHIQVALTEFALSATQDENLRKLTEGKLGVYRQLYHTLDHLTEGRAASMLESHARKHGAPPSETAIADAADDLATKRRATARPKQRGGLSGILQNTTDKAILKVRLEIAGQYADLLRAELAALAPGEFDRNYIGIEVYNQMQVLAVLRVFEQQASDDFARVIHVATAAVEAQVVESRGIVARLNSRLPLPAATEVLVNTADTSGR